LKCPIRSRRSASASMPPTLDPCPYL
jgi:hypothetical protein